MRKNWLAAAWRRRFHTRPVVPEAAFQHEGEPFPGHWRRFPEPWPATPSAEGLTSDQRAALDAALAGLPELWRRVLMARDVAGHHDQQVADDLDLTLEQERAVLARARAGVRDRLDHMRLDGPK
jgi:RNA polymerase sigma-70 factor (ECF subfamily)